MTLVWLEPTPSAAFYSCDLKLPDTVHAFVLQYDSMQACSEIPARSVGHIHMYIGGFHLEPKPDVMKEIYDSFFQALSSRHF